MSGFPNRKSFARGLKAGLPSNIHGGAIIPLNHSSKPLSSEDACGKSVGSAIGRCAKSTIQAASPSNRTRASACRDRKTQWMSKRCPIPPCSARRGIKIDPHCVRRWAADHNPYVRFVSGTIKEAAIVKDRFGSQAEIQTFFLRRTVPGAARELSPFGLAIKEGRPYLIHVEALAPASRPSTHELGRALGPPYPVARGARQLVYSLVIRFSKGAVPGSGSV